MTIIISAGGLDTVILRIDGEDICKIRGGGKIAEAVEQLIIKGDRRNRLPHRFLFEELSSLSSENGWNMIAY